VLNDGVVKIVKGQKEKISNFALIAREATDIIKYQNQEFTVYGYRCSRTQVFEGFVNCEGEEKIQQFKSTETQLL